MFNCIKLLRRFSEGRPQETYFKENHFHSLEKTGKPQQTLVKTIGKKQGKASVCTTPNPVKHRAREEKRIYGSNHKEQPSGNVRAVIPAPARHPLSNVVLQLPRSFCFHQQKVLRSHSPERVLRWPTDKPEVWYRETQRLLLVNDVVASRLRRR